MNIANYLSVLRILIVPFFLSVLVSYTPEKDYLRLIAAGLFFLACITDGVDGYLARKLNQKTVLGSYLDPIADKMLLLGGFAALTFMNHLPQGMHIPLWVTIGVITRDGLILTGFAVLYLSQGHVKAEPLFIGKITTVFQMGTLVGALMLFPASIESVFHWGTFILTVVSGILYIRMGARLAEHPA